MKPCTQNKQRIVWMTLDALDADDARALKVHLNACPGCTQYLKEVGSVCRDHERAAETLAEARVDEAFHRRLKLKIEADAARPALAKSVEAFFRRIAQLTMPQAAAAAGAGLVIALGCLWMGRREVPFSKPNPPNLISKAESSAAGPPTLSSYRMIANTSIEALDDLLTRQAACNPSPGHSLTFSVSSRGEEN